MKQPLLGIKITELRKQKGFTQEELVELCNINVRTLQRIENGEVSPRSYTIKTILSALDQDYEELYEKGTEASQILNLESSKEASSVYKLLTFAWISGIIYFLLGVPEGIADWFRFSEDELVFGTAGHLALKIGSFIFYAFTLYGFLIAGKLLKNYLMKIISILMLFALFFFYLFDGISLFKSSIALEAILVAESILTGILGVLFGIAIIKSQKQLGSVAYVAGGMEILAAFFLLTIVLAPLGLLLLLPAIILEVVLLYKLSTMVKEYKV
ncbi:MAG: helix-turn-helix transcriptional regulator [Maribacter sp.]